MCVILRSTSASPQLTSPLMPHMRVSIPLEPEFVNLGLDVKKLDALKAAVNQASNTIQKSQPKNIFVKEKQQGRSWYSQELLLKPAPPLGLLTKKSRTEFVLVGFFIQPDFSFPVRIFVMLLNVPRD